MGDLQPDGPTGRPVDDGSYGVVEVDGALVGVPLAALHELVLLQEHLAALPARAPGLLGGMQLRGSMVPVLDPVPWYGGPVGASGGERRDVVAVLGHEGRVLGLATDGSHDVVTVSDEALQRVHVAGPHPLLTHTFPHPATGAVVSVLDVGQVFALPGVPSAVADGARPAGTTGDRGGSARRMVTVLRCGSHLLGVGVEHVLTTLPRGAPRPSTLTGGPCLGTTAHDDVAVPLLDTGPLLGLPGTPRARAGLRVVLSVGEAAVALLVDEAVRLLEVRDDDVLAIPPGLVDRPDLVTGLVEADGLGHVLLVDGDGLRRDEQVEAYARLGTPDGPRPATSATAGPAADATGVARGPGPEYLCYDAGGRLATPLAQVAEVVPVPRTLVCAGPDDASLGLTVHRGEAIAVVELAALLGRARPAPGPGASMLVVRAAGRTVGFVVAGLDRIDRLTWHDEADGDVPRSATRAEAAPLVSLGGASTLLPCIDLAAVVGELTARHAAA